MAILVPYRGRHPTIDPTVYLAPNASVIGDVEIGALSSLWFGAVVRGDVMPIRIGLRTNIQDCCVLHVSHDRGPCVVGDDVTVGHAAVLHGCTVKDRVLIGIGSILLDDAVVGSDSLIGAGALVTLGMIIPPRSLVLGRPAKVARPLTDAEVARVAEAARLYVGFRGEFLET